MPEFNWDAINMIPHYTGALSMFGSAWIIGDLVLMVDRKKKLKKSVNRTILAISILDFLSSFWYFMGVWVHPKEGESGLFSANSAARGTTGTCEASGFFIQLSTMSVPLYNTALAMQYFLSIKYSWSDERIYQRFERYIHPVILLFAFTMAIIPLPLDLYNRYYFYCYITASGYNDETQEFARGTRLADDIFKSIYFVVVFSCGILVTGIMLAIYLAVRKTIQKSTLYDFGENSNTSNQNNNDGAGVGRNRPSIGRLASSVSSVVLGSFSSMGSLDSAADGEAGDRRRKKRAKRRDQRTKQVATMALLYTAPFYITWIVPACIFLKQFLAFRGMARFNPNARLVYASNVYVSTALPLQGFLKWLIYFNPWFHKKIKKMFGANCCNSCYVGLFFTRRAGRKSTDPHGPPEPDADGMNGDADEQVLKNAVDFAASWGGKKAAERGDLHSTQEMAVPPPSVQTPPGIEEEPNDNASSSSSSAQMEIVFVSGDEDGGSGPLSW